MSAQVWWRNPELYVRECVEIGVTDIAWDRGYLVKKRIDPERFGNLWYPASMDYRMLLIGDQGTAEVRRGRPQTNPVAVYPTWLYGHDDLATLEDLLQRPVGEDDKACGDTRLPADERPVLGQEHRVIISDTPNAGTGIGRKFYALLAELQRDYPAAIIHVHGLYSYRAAFGHAFGAADIDPRTLAKKGKVTLPNGKEVTYEKASLSPQWIDVVGMTASELEVPRNRCMYNMRSAQWAADNYRDNIKFRVSGQVPVDPDDANPASLTVIGVKSQSVAPMVGDKVTCDTCSLQNTCKYFRAGSVCSLPDSDGSKLAKLFDTRDSATIIDGLSALMIEQAKRMEMGRRIEDEEGELHPEVTKIIDGLFDKGVKIARLIDPSLTSKPHINVGVQVNGGAITTGSGPTQTELAAQAVLALESIGYRRDEMTAELIEAVMKGQPVPEPVRAIEATASG